MAGLDSITEKILADAKLDSNKKLIEAREKASAIAAENAAAIEKIKADTVGRLQEKELSAKDRLALSLKARERDAILKTEQETISDIIREAKDRLLSLPKEEYFELLADLYKNNSEDREGELLLTQSDRERMDEDFVKRLSDIKGTLTLSEGDAPSAGFIVRYGKVEQNCTFDAIFDQMYNHFVDIAIQCIKE